MLNQEVFSIFQTEGRAKMFMTSRRGGVSKGAYDSLNLGLFSGDELQNVRQNRRLLCEALDVKESDLVVPKEVHGNAVRWVRREELPLSDEEVECDALITCDEEVVLGVTTADCVPMLLYDAKDFQVVSAIHAGWKGVVKEILPQTIREIKERLGISPSNLKLKVYPCIGVEDFEVGEEVAQQFTRYGEAVVVREGYEKPHVDLPQIVCIQALQNGILIENLEVVRKKLTADTFYSARRDGFHSGRMLSGIFLR